MCRIDGCDNKRLGGKGYCRKHYTQAVRSGWVDRPQCREVDCNSPAFCKGLCSVHYEVDRKKRTQCSEAGCADGVHAYGMCANHYLKARRRKLVPYKPCSIGGCERVAEQSGLCVAHSIRKMKYGDVNFRKRVGNNEQTPEMKTATAKKCQTTYRKTLHGKIRLYLKSANKRLRDGASFHPLTREQGQKLWSTRVCPLCGEAMKDEDKSIDHIIPLSKGGENVLSNMQITHLRCNQKKSNRVLPVVERASS